MTTVSPDRDAALAPSLYDAIGGQPAITLAVDVFYAKMLSDPELKRYFPGGVGAKHRAHLAAILCQALGGPEKYDGPDLGEAHARHRITNAHFDKTAGHLAATLTELGVPEDLNGKIIEIVASLRPVVVTG
jgi:hemoglobin